MQPDFDRFAALVRQDAELALMLGRLSAHVRIGPDASAYDIIIKDGRVIDVVPDSGEAVDLLISASDDFWTGTLMPVPSYAFASLTSGGARFDGDLAAFVAPHYSAWERVLRLLRLATCDVPSPRAVPDRRETDDAVGRYAWITNGDVEARLYYEEAGQGSVPLLLHATAGADGRQWRHMLAYPPLRERFRMIAYDVPGHGKSLPAGPDARWWEAAYRPSRDLLMGWATGLAAKLGLDRPVFLGCSVGGQLAIDLAAWRPEHFRALVSLNGWAMPSPAMRSFDNAPYRDPAISPELYVGRVLATTSPLAPEDRRHETAFIYRSNAPGLYAGDNDYFMAAHDLSVDGAQIDTERTPLFVLAGEYDRTSLSPDHGAPAVPRYVPGAQYRLLEGLGHFAPSDDPERFCEAITPILDEVLAACAQVEDPV